jgi:hypothetical protein
MITQNKKLERLFNSLRDLQEKQTGNYGLEARDEGLLTADC